MRLFNGVEISRTSLCGDSDTATNDRVNDVNVAGWETDNDSGRLTGWQLEEKAAVLPTSRPSPTISTHTGTRMEGAICLIGDAVLLVIY